MGGLKAEGGRPRDGRDEFWLTEFLRLEAAGGVLLVLAAALALVVANSPLAPWYRAGLVVAVEIRVGSASLAKPLLLWVNDGLMAVFFLLVGLELKREALQGHLAGPQAMILPAIGALGGMAVPAGIYVFWNRGDPGALQGWAIPAATDIAFALGILALLGPRVPPALKVFLLGVAIFDDLGAIVIIALFYSGDLSWPALWIAVGCLLALAALNRAGVSNLLGYFLLAAVLWGAVLKSGVHATLAGVALAAFVPLRPRDGDSVSPLLWLEHALHPWVAWGILPLFAFANAGVPLAGFAPGSLWHPVPLGIASGLVFGKLIGVWGATRLAVAAGLATLPDGIRWSQILGASLLCGVGFTMSLFIASLAFEHGAPIDPGLERLGILAGSLAAGIAGYVTLHAVLPSRDAAP